MNFKSIQENIKDRKSLKTFRKLLILLMLGGLIEYLLFLNLSTTPGGSKSILIHLVYSFGIIGIFFNAVFAVCSLIGLIVDVIEFILTGNIS